MTSNIYDDRKNEQMWRRYEQNLQSSYRTTFNGDNKKIHAAAKEVIADLKTFCHGQSTTFYSDPYQMARAAGRREVYIRIMDYLNIDYNDQYDYIPEYEEF